MNWFRTSNSAIVLLFAVCSVTSGQRGPAPVAVAPVVEREQSAAAQTFIGTVMPLKRSAVGSAVDGRVVEFPVNEGDRVKKGQTLAQLLTETLKLELAAAQAQLTLHEQELAELKNGSRKEEIEQAQAQMLATKALMDYSKSNYKRLQELARQRAINQDEVELSLSKSVEAENNYLQQKAAYALVLAGTRVEKIAQAKARVDMQSQVVSRLQDQIEKHTIVAPFDGYVIAEHTEVGQWVGRGELVAEVIALDEVDVQVSILEQHVPYVVKGMSSPVDVPALAGRQFTGQVALVIPQADVRSRTFPVKIRVKNPTDGKGPLLKAGMLARVTLSVAPKTRMLMVSKDALVFGGSKPIVFVFEPGKKDEMTGEIRPVPVELGIAVGNLMQVTGPLKKDYLVVVRGNERLRPGQQVVVTTVVPSGVERK